MTDYNEELEQLAVVRRLNRAQRSLNHQLRRDHRRFHAEADENFAALCKADLPAQTALQRLWREGGFTCEPDDYREMIDYCLDVMWKYESLTA